MVFPEKSDKEAFRRWRMLLEVARHSCRQTRTATWKRVGAGAAGRMLFVFNHILPLIVSHGEFI